MTFSGAACVRKRIHAKTYSCQLVISLKPSIATSLQLVAPLLLPRPSFCCHSWRVSALNRH